MINETIQGFRLSPQQQRLAVLQGHTRAYTAHGAIRIDGQLNPGLLHRSVRDVVSRHEILRTTFRRQPGMRFPFQIVEETLAEEWAEHDLRGQDREEQEAQIEALWQEERRRPFEMQHGPLLRLCLIARSAREHVLFVALLSLCADAASLANLTREISRSYAAGATGDPVIGEPMQYADLSEWQNELLEAADPESERGREFWSRWQVASPPALVLPLEREPEPESLFDPAAVPVVLDPELAQQIESVSHRIDTSPSAFVLACWQTLLWRLTGQSELCIGTLFDGRKFDELKEALGLFARHLPLSCPMDADSSLSTLAERLEEAIRDASRWQEFFAWNSISGLPDTSRDPPFFSALFSFDEQPPSHESAGVSFSMCRQHCCSERFKVQLACQYTGGSMSAEIRYDARLYGSEPMQRLAGQLEKLLDSAARQPAASVSELGILTEAERQQLLIEFNQTAVPFAPERCVHELFEEQARRAPEQTALVFEDEQLTYGQLDHRANQLAHHLRALGVGQEVLVGICTERSLETVVGLLGVLKAGGAYMPLDPALPKERLAFMLEDGQVPVLLTQERLLELLPPTDAHVVCLDGDFLARESVNNPASGPTSTSPAYVIYTSGSTGRPKGVVVEHRQLSNYVRGAVERLALPPGASYAMVSTFAADLGHTMLFPSLCLGGSLHIISEERASSPERLVEYFQRHPIDCLKIVPSHLAALLACSRPEQLLPRQRLVLGGEACRWELITRLWELAPPCRIFNHYGPTETTVGATTYAVKQEEERPPSVSVPLGRPLPNCLTYVLDSHRQPVPVGVVGELYIGGRGVARGYLNRPEQTEERFVPDLSTQAGGASAHDGGLESGGARLYRTGDLARYLPDGSLEFIGRLDDQVKIHGFRIELGEIEAVLLQHPEVRECVLLAREDRSGATPGAGEKRLVAYVVPRRHPYPAAGELRSHLRNSLPEFMVPGAFVSLDRLPLTANGKVNRQALPEPDHAALDRTESYVAPRTPVEQLLAGIWTDVLRQRLVGIHDNFFDLGGDSILSIQIIARASQSGVTLTPKQLFQHQTIAALAAVAGAAARVETDQGLVSGPVPLTPIQHRFFEQELPEPHHWNMTLLLETREHLDLSVLEQAVQHLVFHHDALRLRYVREASGWRQFHAPPEPAIPARRIELSTLPQVDQGPAMLAAGTSLQRGLDLGKGPLVQLGLFDGGPDRPQRLLMVIHHLLVDGVSWRILLEDLWTVYQQLRRGETAQLPPKSSSFKQWVVQLQEHARSAAVAAELPYWLGLPFNRIAPLPVDVDGANTEGSARIVSVELDETETRALLQEVPAAYRTQINDVLLTALVESFSHWTGRRSLLVDLEGHGREEIGDELDLSRTVGWFTTVFPVLLDWGEAADTLVGLKMIKEQLRAIPQRGLGYGLLRYLHPDPALRAQLAALPRPEVSFNYLGQFDQVLPGEAPWRLAWEGIGPLRSPQCRRLHLLNVIGRVNADRLRWDWVFSEAVHHRATIERLAAGFTEALRSLIRLSQDPEAGKFTVSDFPGARIGQKDLDRLLSRIGQAGARPHK
jgi:amino acid adenylation domain-containing protein/non-ribosomal peptide synthase protein (TIGR01720 family)